MSLSINRLQQHYLRSRSANRITESEKKMNFFIKNSLSVAKSMFCFHYDTPNS